MCRHRAYMRRIIIRSDIDAAYDVRVDFLADPFVILLKTVSVPDRATDRWPPNDLEQRAGLNERPVTSCQVVDNDPRWYGVIKAAEWLYWRLP